MTSFLVTTVICPRCRAELDARAVVCAQCGTLLSDATPPAVASQAGEPRLIDRPWLIVVILLHVGLLGIPYYLATRYSWTIRLLICAASIVYTILAVAGIMWGIGQILRLFEAA